MGSKGIKLKDNNGNDMFPCPYYPIGSIYISVNETNPSEYFGGTWVSFGTGRTLVGIDTTQTEFNTIEKTGGSKHLQKHAHSAGKYDNSGIANIAVSGGSGYQAIIASGNSATSRIVTNDAGTGDSGNLQPYITVYMWKRTA